MPYLFFLLHSYLCAAMPAFYTLSASLLTLDQAPCKTAMDVTRGYACLHGPLELNSTEN